MLIFVIIGHAWLKQREINTTALINAHITDAAVLLKQSVNSGTLNIAGVKAVGELYAVELKKPGFTVE